MSLELKVVLLTMALVAYLVLFNIHPCWRMDCCGLVANLTETNGTLRWGPKHPQSHHPSVLRGMSCCICSVLHLPLQSHLDWTPGGAGLAGGTVSIFQKGTGWSQVYTQS